MLIRRAQGHDAKAASSLIVSSGASLLPLLFNVADLDAPAFLQSAFVMQDGQFGYANHWVIESDNQVVAIVCGWHSELPETFHQATIKSIALYYGVNHSLEVIRRCQALKDIFPAPQQDEWCVGHLAVSTFYRRQGLGARLITHMHKLALSKGKTSLTLDVESANQTAQLFYKNLGFRIVKQQVNGQMANSSGIGPYTHMVLPISN